jgi:hypothetical protein
VSQSLQEVFVFEKWFEVQEYVKEKEMEGPMSDPCRIFKGDETCFWICPSTGRVLARKCVLC